jgi:hypothetical protein
MTTYQMGMILAGSISLNTVTLETLQESESYLISKVYKSKVLKNNSLQFSALEE